jgi:hypothetical protein
MEAGMCDGLALGHCVLCFAEASEAEVARCEMPVPHELEAALLDEIGGKGETVVAFALLRWGGSPARDRLRIGQLDANAPLLG